MILFIIQLVMGLILLVSFFYFVTQGADSKKADTFLKIFFVLLGIGIFFIVINIGFFASCLINEVR